VIVAPWDGIALISMERFKREKACGGFLDIER
jgi:hypothetical protein